MRLPLALLPFFVLALPAQEPTAAPTTIAWHDDFAAARALAAKEHKPLFVTFRCER